MAIPASAPADKPFSALGSSGMVSVAVAVGVGVPVLLAGTVDAVSAFSGIVSLTLQQCKEGTRYTALAGSILMIEEGEKL